MRIIRKMVRQLEEFRSEMDEDELRQFTSDYFIPLAMHPEVPDSDACVADFPEGKIGVYTCFFVFANQRVPISLFLSNVLNFYRLHISQLHCIGAAKITNFEVNHRLLAINPTINLFRAFYHTIWSHGWVSFAKRAGRLQCYIDKVDSLRDWREKFFWVDDVVFPSRLSSILKGRCQGMSALYPVRIVQRMRTLLMRTAFPLTPILRSFWFMWG